METSNILLHRPQTSLPPRCQVPTATTRCRCEPARARPHAAGTHQLGLFSINTLSVFLPEAPEVCLEFLFLEKSCDSAALCWPRSSCASSTSPPGRGISRKRLQATSHSATPLSALPTNTLCPYLTLPPFLPLHSPYSRSPVTPRGSQMLRAKGPILARLVQTLVNFKAPKLSPT